MCALDSTGAIWTWGYAAYGRLGLNETPPKDHWTPTQITGFVERKNPVKHVCCGSSWGMCIDSRDALHVWGKWKNTGDGGQGTPWLYPKHFSGLSGWTLRAIGAGASSLFALGENSTVSWGQNCGSGELAHGEGTSLLIFFRKSAICYEQCAGRSTRRHVCAFIGVWRWQYFVCC